MKKNKKTNPKITTALSILEKVLEVELYSPERSDLTVEWPNGFRARVKIIGAAAPQDNPDGYYYVFFVKVLENTSRLHRFSFVKTGDEFVLSKSCPPNNLYSQDERKVWSFPREKVNPLSRKNMFPIFERKRSLFSRTLDIEKFIKFINFKREYRNVLSPKAKREILRYSKKIRKSILSKIIPDFSKLFQYLFRCIEIFAANKKKSFLSETLFGVFQDDIFRIVQESVLGYPTISEKEICQRIA